MSESNKKIEDYFIKKIIKREYPAINNLFYKVILYLFIRFAHL